MSIADFRDIITTAQVSTALVIIAVALAVIAVKLAEKGSHKSSR